MTRTALLYLPRPPELEAYLTHVCLMKLGGEEIAVGEAGEVQRTSPHEFTAVIGMWGFNPVTKRLDHSHFASVDDLTVPASEYRFVLKAEFTGSFPS